jgi:hypothetical protein
LYNEKLIIQCLTNSFGFTFVSDNGGSRKSVRGRRLVEGDGGHGQKTILEVYLTHAVSFFFLFLLRKNRKKISGGGGGRRFAEQLDPPVVSDLNIVITRISVIYMLIDKDVLLNRKLPRKDDKGFKKNL